MGEGGRGRVLRLGLAGLLLVAGCAVRVAGPPGPGSDAGSAGGPPGGGADGGPVDGGPTPPPAPAWSRLRALGPSTGWQPIFVGAVSGGGAVVIGWNTFGGVQAVRAWAFDPTSRSFGPATLVDGGGALEAPVAAAAGGQAVVLWPQDAPAGGVELEAARYTPAGGWSAPVTVATGTQGALQRYAISAGASGGALATWDDGHAAYGATFDPAAGWTPLPGRLAATWVTPSAAAGGGGVVSWAAHPTGGPCVVRAAWVTPGTGFGASKDLGPDACGNAPTVGIGTGGKATALWLGGGSQPGILAARGAPDGTWSAPVRLDDPTAPKPASFPTPQALLVAAGDGAVAMWQRTDPQTYLPQVFAARYRPGSGWTKETRVSSWLYGTLALSANPQGQALVAWQTASLGTLGNVAISDGAPDGTWSAETDLDRNGPVHAALGDGGAGWVFLSDATGLTYTYRPPP